MVQSPEGRVHGLDADIVDAGLANATEHLVAVRGFVGKDCENRKVQRLSKPLAHDHDVECRGRGDPSPEPLRLAAPLCGNGSERVRAVGCPLIRPDADE